MDLPRRIDTHRLLLRPWDPADARDLEAALAESVDHLLPWIPWATPEPPTSDEVDALAARWIMERDSGANLIYAIIDRATGGILGGIGAYDRVGEGRLEIGYWTRASAVGRGYATEAARALTEAVLALDGIVAVEIRTDPTNLASRRIPEKLGYRWTGDRQGPTGRMTAIFTLHPH